MDESAAVQGGDTGAPQPEAHATSVEETRSSPQRSAGVGIPEESAGSARGGRQDPGSSRGPSTSQGGWGDTTWVLEVTGGSSGRFAFFQAALQAAHLGLDKLGEEVAKEEAGLAEERCRLAEAWYRFRDVMEADRKAE